jgi:hypothetical protein
VVLALIYISVTFPSFPLALFKKCNRSSMYNDLQQRSSDSILTMPLRQILSHQNQDLKSHAVIFARGSECFSEIGYFGGEIGDRKSLLSNRRCLIGKAAKNQSVRGI